MTNGLLNNPLRLPNGRNLKNRLAKAALSECLADARNGPSEGLLRVYDRWAQGGAGLVITGNVMVDGRARTEPSNVVVEDERHYAELERWADTGKQNGVTLIAQLNHPGRQAVRTDRRPVAPSEVEMKGLKLFFKKPRALEDREIEEIVDRFVRTAVIFEKVGFDGVQIHAAHGYLISQFLSPRANLRDDRWGGDPERRMRLLLEIVGRVREHVSSRFILAVKLNSADFMRGGFDEEESMNVVRALDRSGIDLLEISGGNYEAPAMMGTARASTVQREAYFLEYAEKVRSLTRIPLMVTGGFRSREAMETALAGAVDLIGLGRPMILEPDLPLRLMIGEAERARKVDVSVGVRLLDGVLQGSWYQEQLYRLASGLEPDPELGRWGMVWAGVRERVMPAGAAA
jgi:2,4-dienoyl-CoA reductase-like NADH-dependent reductase (Old Yellow Enzyme family)